MAFNSRLFVELNCPAWTVNYKKHHAPQPEKRDTVQAIDVFWFAESSLIHARTELDFQLHLEPSIPPC